MHLLIDKIHKFGGPFVESCGVPQDDLNGDPTCKLLFVVL